VRALREEFAAAVSIRDADVRLQKLLLDQARIDMIRTENLMAKKVVPKEQYERAKAAFEVAQAALESAKALKKQSEIALENHATSIAQARADVEVKKAALTQSEAAIRTREELVKGRDVQVRLARLNLGYTTITAPADGFVTKKVVSIGSQIQAGQPLMALVSLRGQYVVANYKETQIHSIKVGQRARIRVDALPGREFSGRVNSIMAGTGAAFSLFPPENASGNYVKVVQRVPVKISLDPDQGVEEVLRVGMSVISTVIAKE
jgi:membrane fusion protein (multidrug efflux system)